MSWTDSLVAEARSRHPERMAPRERVVMRVSAVSFSLVAVAIAAWLPSERSLDVLLALGLVLGYAVASRVRFEVGSNYVVPEELLLVPMLLLLPLPLVPALV